MDSVDDVEHQKNIQMMEESISIIRDTTKKVKKLPISTFQRWKGCDELKLELLEILYKIEAKLEAFKAVIEYKIQKFKNKLNYTALKKYIMQMHLLGKFLIGISVIFIVGMMVLFTYELATGIIAIISSTALNPAQIVSLGVSGVGLGLIFVTFTIDAIISFWQASKNKGKLQQAIQQGNKALKEIDNKIKQQAMK